MSEPSCTQLSRRSVTISGATAATAWNWKPIDVRVTNTIASATHAFVMWRGS